MRDEAELEKVIQKILDLIENERLTYKEASYVIGELFTRNLIARAVVNIRARTAK